MRVRLSAPVLTLLISVAATTAAQSGRFDYPQWRGLHRDGGASRFVEPSAWPAALTRQWTVAVGEGYATPLVIGDRVFVFTRRNDDEMLTALDAETGSVLWQTTYAAPYDMFAATIVHGPGPRATPLFVDGKLFTLGISGIVSAFDADNGRLLWQTPRPAEQPFYGTASSPAADGDLVFVHTGNYDGLTAFDRDTGAVAWRTAGAFTYSSPLIVELDGVRQVVSISQEQRGRSVRAAMESCSGPIRSHRPTSTPSHRWSTRGESSSALRTWAFGRCGHVASGRAGPSRPHGGTTTSRRR